MSGDTPLIQPTQDANIRQGNLYTGVRDSDRSVEATTASQLAWAQGEVRAKRMSEEQFALLTDPYGYLKRAQDYLTSVWKDGSEEAKQWVSLAYGEGPGAVFKLANEYKQADLGVRELFFHVSPEAIKNRSGTRGAVKAFF